MTRQISKRVGLSKRKRARTRVVNSRMCPQGAAGVLPSPSAGACPTESMMEMVNNQSEAWREDGHAMVKFDNFPFIHNLSHAVRG